MSTEVFTRRHLGGSIRDEGINTIRESNGALDRLETIKQASAGYALRHILIYSSENDDPGA
jgi:hypothetical protein